VPRSFQLGRPDLRTLAWAALAVAVAALAGVGVGKSAQLAFDGVLVALAAVVFASRPFAVLVGLLVLLPSFSGTPFDPGSVLVILVTLAAGLLVLFLVAPRPASLWVMLPLALLLVLALLSVRVLPGSDEVVGDYQLHLPVLNQPYLKTPSGALMDLLRLGAVFVVAGLAMWAVRSRARLDVVIGAVLASAVVPIAYAFDQLATGATVTRPGVDSPPAVEGTFTHPNHFAFYLVVVLTLTLSSLLEARRLIARVVLVALFGCAAVCLFLTYTRSGWIGFGLAVLVMGLLRYRALVFVAPIVLVVAAFALPGAVTKVQKRFGDLTSQSEAAADNSWSWRTGQWSKMLPYGSRKPLTGQGFGSYAPLTVKRFGYENPRYPTITIAADGTLSKGFSAHNDYVKMFVELGIPGVVLWCLVLIGLLVTGLSALRLPQLAGPAAAVVAIAVMLMVVSVSDNLQGYSIVLAAAFAVAGGLAGAASGIRSQRPAAASVAEAAPIRAPEEPQLADEPQSDEAAEQPEEAAEQPDEGPEPPVERARRVERRSGGLLGLLRRRRL
jgi:O-antigen ligase